MKDILRVTYSIFLLSIVSAFAQSQPTEENAAEVQHFNRSILDYDQKDLPSTSI